MLGVYAWKKEEGGVDKVTLERDLKGEDANVSRHRSLCKICQSHLTDEINGLLLEGKTDAQIIRYAERNGLEINRANLRSHKKYLPQLTRQEIAREKKIEEMTKIEADIAYAQFKIDQEQAAAIGKIWHEVVPTLLQRIIEVANSKNVALTSLSETLDQVVKIAQLVDNKPTDRKELITNDYAGTRNEDIRLALEALREANRSIDGFFNSRGTEKVGTH